MNWGSNTTGNIFLQFDHSGAGYTNPINGTTVQYNLVNGVSATVIEKINDRIGG